MTENRLFILGRPETQLHDILWAVHDRKTVVEARTRKISASSRLRWVVGAEQCMEVYAFLLYIYARVCKALGSTEPERGVRLLNPSDCTSYVTEPERSIPWLLTEPERFLRYCC